MTTETEPQSPWTRPGFIAAGVVIVLIVLAGIVVAVVSLRGGGTDAPTAAPTPSTSPSAAAEDPEASVCGLDGVDLDGEPITVGPDATWAYEGVVGYPTSPDFGAGATTAGGARYCFQHTPEGALFMAANALAVPMDSEVAREWADYAIADGPFRSDLLAEQTEDTSTTGVRMAIEGFRILDYTGSTARVDLGVGFSTNGRAGKASFIYYLVWQDGDWKISADVETPVDFADVPSLAGYTAWGA